MLNLFCYFIERYWFRPFFSINARISAATVETPSARNLSSGQFLNTAGEGERYFFSGSAKGALRFPFFKIRILFNRFRKSREETAVLAFFKKGPRMSSSEVSKGYRR